MKTLIKNVYIVNSDKIQNGNILIENGLIKQIGDFDADESTLDKVLERKNQYVFPGFIDFHVHLDDQIGEFYIADTYASGTEKAIRNGITTIMSFITQERDKTLQDNIKKSLSKAKLQIHTDLGYHLTPTTFSEKDYAEIDELIEQGFKTFKFYTTYKKAGIYADYAMIDEFMKRYQNEDIRILVHCEDDKVLQEAAAKHEKTNFIYHSKSRPKSAEIKAVKEMIKLSRKHQVAVHIVHVTCAESVKLLIQAKKTAPITFETGMQYLYFDESIYQQENANYYFCTPSFHDKENTDKMRKLAKSGMFDIFATDHCPFTKVDKDKYKSEQDKIPNGLPGLSYHAKLAFEIFEELTNDVLMLLCEKLSTNPAILIGQYPQKGKIEIGSQADLVICDFSKLSKIENDDKIFIPYTDFKTRLNISDVIFKGELKYSKNNFFDGTKTGLFLFDETGLGI